MRPCAGKAADKIAGFSRALRRPCGGDIAEKADLDWPSYCRGTKSCAPFCFFARRGVLLVRRGTLCRSNVGIAINQPPRPCGSGLNLSGTECGYSPLETLSLRRLRVVELRDTFGLRVVVSTRCCGCGTVAVPAQQFKAYFIRHTAAFKAGRPPHFFWGQKGI